MNHREFADATAKLRAGGVDLEQWLRVNQSTISRWEAGAASVPSVRARQVTWLLEAERNRERREAAGLEECIWLERHSSTFAALHKPSLEQVEAYANDLEEHCRTCPTCIGNEAWAKANLADLGPYPMAGLSGKALGLLAQTPQSMVPAVIGAVLLGAIVILRVFVATAIALVRGSDLGTAATLLGWGIAAALGAAAAGASGGLVLSLVRPWLRPLGALGDYLTGILVVWAYAFSIGLLAQFAFDEPLLEEGYPLFVLIYGGLLGAFGAFMHRRDQAKTRQRRPV